MYLHLGNELLDILGLVLSLVLCERLGAFLYVLPVIGGDGGDGSSEACPCEKLNHDGGRKGLEGRELESSRED